VSEVRGLIHSVKDQLGAVAFGKTENPLWGVI